MTTLLPNTLYRYFSPEIITQQQWLPLYIAKIYYYPKKSALKRLDELNIENYLNLTREGELEIEYSIAGDADSYGEAFRTFEPKWEEIIPRVKVIESENDHAIADALFSQWQERSTWISYDNIF